MKVLYGHSEVLVELAEKNLLDIAPFGVGGQKAKAVGVVTGDGENDKLHAIAIFNEYNPVFKTCSVCFVAFSPKWAIRGIIKEILSIPFQQYNMKKLWAMTSSDNKRCQKLLIGLGFTKEAVLANHLGAKRHALIYRMMEPDFRKKYLDSQKEKCY